MPNNPEQATHSDNQSPPDRSGLATERRNPRSTQLGSLDTASIVKLMADEDAAVLTAMHKAEPTLTALIDSIIPLWNQGGRVIYIGAGTSGRLGVLDASEAPPTFHIEQGRIIGIIAGGDSALRNSSEGKEDDPQGSHAALNEINLTSNDTLIGIASGGTTPYTVGALQHAKSQHTNTAFIVCTPVPHPTFIDHLITLDTGPEVLTGSTRLKAGTATKLALNTISTTLMARTGRVYQNLMVDLKPTNDKLKDRAARIIAKIVGIPRDPALEWLNQAGGSVKIAAVMAKNNITRDEAIALLNEANGNLRDVLDD